MGATWLIEGEWRGEGGISIYIPPFTIDSHQGGNGEHACSSKPFVPHKQGVQGRSLLVNHIQLASCRNSHMGGWARKALI